MVQLLISGTKHARDFTVDVGEDATVVDVKFAVFEKNKKLYPSRQRLTLVEDTKKRLSDDTKLSDALDGQLKDGVELKLKDLGPQVNWQTVFLVEYLGPLIIHPLLYHFPKFWFGKDFQHSTLQKYIYAFVMIHFIKRELETLFIHRFSHSTMPVSNIFKNSFHYHVSSGLLLAVDIYRSKYSSTSPYIVNTIRDNERVLWISVCLLAFLELSNFHTHLKLRSLRPAGTKIRAIPYGYGYDFVSFPNYFFEILIWLTICIITNSIAACFFTTCGIVQMVFWAVKKHENYKKEFGKEYPPRRKAIIPFLL